VAGSDTDLHTEIKNAGFAFQFSTQTNGYARLVGSLVVGKCTLTPDNLKAPEAERGWLKVVGIVHAARAYEL
jgi:hypothetical protein